MKLTLSILFLCANFIGFAQSPNIDLPYNYSFESDDGWMNINAGPGNPWEITNESDNLYGPSDGEYYARMDNSNQFDATAWLYSRPINVEEGDVIVLEFDYRSSLDALFPQKMQVLLKNIPTPNEDGSIQLWENTTIQTSSYQTAFVTFLAEETATYYLTFNAFSEPNLGYLSLDNIKMYVEECEKPFNISVQATQTSAILNWETSNVIADGYEYVVQAQDLGEPTGSGVHTDSNYMEANGLSPEQDYEVYIRSICDAAEPLYSHWSGPINFTTYPETQVEPTNLPYTSIFDQASDWTIIEPTQGNAWEITDAVVPGMYGPSQGTHYARFSNSNTTNADSWIFSRGLNLSAGDQVTIEFDYKSSQDDAYPQKMEAVLSKTPFPSASENVQIWSNSEIQSTTFQTASVLVEIEEDGVYYIGNHAYSDANYGFLSLDNLNVYREGESPCEYVLRLKDVIGDGWSGNSLDLLVNGQVVFDDLTIEYDLKQDFTFQVSSGDEITVIWNAGGSSSWETSYEIYDSENNLVGSASEENIDEPIIAFCPNCSKPSNFIAHEAQRTVNLFWDFLTAPEFGYEYVVQPAGTGIPNSGTQTANTNAFVDNLTPETNYESYVRAVCTTNSEYSTWAGPITFTTLPEPGQAVDLPYYYGFEEADGWVSQSVNRPAINWEITNQTSQFNDCIGPSEGDYYAYQNSVSYLDADAWFFSKGLNLIEGEEVVIKFDYRAFGLGNLSVHVGNGAYAYAQTEEIWRDDEILDNECPYIPAAILYTPTESGVFYIGFQSETVKNNSVMFDNFKIYSIGNQEPPSCSFICPEDIEVAVEEDEIGAVVTYDISFECQGPNAENVFPVLTRGYSSGAIFPVGETLVSYDLMYNSEVLETCSFIVKVEESLGVQETDQVKFFYYPNPVQDVFHFSSSHPLESITLYSLQGQQIEKYTVNTTSGEIIVSNLSPGIYFAKIASSQGFKMVKVLKR